ncbi:Polyunsaturated fatty acid lipoxygenase ALOX12 [Manis javanica]|nr:Polyunsaturated fatty acid lipoxygenase ALOX12 [Manis javanica]
MQGSAKQSHEAPVLNSYPGLYGGTCDEETDVLLLPLGPHKPLCPAAGRTTWGPLSIPRSGLAGASSELALVRKPSWPPSRPELRPCPRRLQRGLLRFSPLGSSHYLTQEGHSWLPDASSRTGPALCVSTVHLCTRRLSGEAHG